MSAKKDQQIERDQGSWFVCMVTGHGLALFLFVRAAGVNKSLYTCTSKNRVSRDQPIAHIVLPTSAISSQQSFMVYTLCSLNRLLCFSGWVSVSGLCHGGGSVHLAGHRVRRTSLALSPETSRLHSIPHSCALLPTRLTP